MEAHQRTLEIGGRKGSGGGNAPGGVCAKTLRSAPERGSDSDAAAIGMADRLAVAIAHGQCPAQWLPGLQQDAAADFAATAFAGRLFVFAFIA